MGSLIQQKKKIMMMQKTEKNENLIKIDELHDGYVWWVGNEAPGYSNHCTTPKISVIPGATYYLSRNSNNQNYVSYFGQNKEYIEQIIWSDNPQDAEKQIPNNVYYVGITIAKDSKNTAVFKKV